jgi:hypothetical protein
MPEVRHRHGRVRRGDGLLRSSPSLIPCRRVYDGLKNKAGEFRDVAIELLIGAGKTLVGMTVTALGYPAVVSLRLGGWAGLGTRRR